METLEPIVLLAEDSEDDAFFFERAFSKANVKCSLVRAENGKVAIEMLRDRMGDRGGFPFLIFLDLKMPVISGFEVLQWLREMELRRRPKVLVLSGSNDHSDRVKAIHLGAVDYLVKPITVESLRARLCAELRSCDGGEARI